METIYKMTFGYYIDLGMECVFQEAILGLFTTKEEICATLKKLENENKFKPVLVTHYEDSKEFNIENNYELLSASLNDNCYIRVKVFEIGEDILFDISHSNLEFCKDKEGNQTDEVVFVIKGYTANECCL